MSDICAGHQSHLASPLGAITVDQGLATAAAVITTVQFALFPKC